MLRFDCTLPFLPAGSLPQLFTGSIYSEKSLLMHKPYKYPTIIAWSNKLIILMQPSFHLHVRYIALSTKC